MVICSRGDIVACIEWCFLRKLWDLHIYLQEMIRAVQVMMGDHECLH